MNSRPSILIIGAGFTGCALAHDLSLRGVNVTVLERGEIASGTSGRTHGLLHSGARYCVTDPEAAIECITESRILSQIAAQCIEYNGGLFVALNDQDLAYSAAFEQGAQATGIPIERLSPQQALQREPNLNPNLLAAYTVPDGTFDPLRLALAFAATARQNGAVFLTHHEVQALHADGQGRITKLTAWNRHTGQQQTFTADLIISATGAWAGQIAAMVGASTVVKPTPGIMVAYNQRLVHHAINRLCPPDDGDILIPQRRMVVIGTTSFEVENPDYIPITAEQTEQMQRAAEALVPAIANTQRRGVYMSARPLIVSGSSGRSLSRTFKCYDHEALDGLPGLITITGGKATTCRIMAEKTADLACQKLGLSAPCRTKDVPLRSYRLYYS
ncbi:MAG: FAD-dependent oxidoreductase [Anaerolinea sp.]|nr:FAD-dependent oxidoreductase [Anaerolinea sp.]